MSGWWVAIGLGLVLLWIHDPSKEEWDFQTRKWDEEDKADKEERYKRFLEEHSE